MILYHPHLFSAGDIFVASCYFFLGFAILPLDKIATYSIITFAFSGIV